MSKACALAATHILQGAKCYRNQGYYVKGVEVKANGLGISRRPTLIVEGREEG